MEKTLFCLYCRKNVKAFIKLDILKLTCDYKCKKPKQNISKQNPADVQKKITY